MIKYIKFIFYIIPIIIIFLKSIDNIFIESIKMRYSDVPGKLSDFSIIINFLGKLLIGFEFMFLIVYIFIFFIGDVNVTSDAIDINLSKSSLCGFVLAFLFILNICLTVNGYNKIRFNYINLLEEKNYIKNLNNKVFITNICLSYFNSIIYVALVVIEIIVIASGEESANLAEKNIIFLSFISLGCIIMAIISNSLKKALSEICEKKEYIFIYGDDQFIKTNLYLDFKDNYLIIKDGYEVFIPKNSIKRKIVKHKAIT